MRVWFHQMTNYLLSMRGETPKNCSRRPLALAAFAPYLCSIIHLRVEGFAITN